MTLQLDSVKKEVLRAKRICNNAVWNAWADAWLSGEDRSAEAAEAAARAAEAADFEVFCSAVGGSWAFPSAQEMSLKSASAASWSARAMDLNA